MGTSAGDTHGTMKRWRSPVVLIYSTMLYCNTATLASGAHGTADYALKQRREDDPDCPPAE
jgi:hypothetical protein